LYNLLITAQPGLWRGSAYEYERGRCVREYTDSAIVEKYKSFSRNDVAELMSFPCLFAYEDQVRKNARIGWLTDIKPRTHAVRVEYELEEGLPSITPAKVRKLASELDITDWELNRTHWAVKDVNLFRILMTAGILTEAKIRECGEGSKLVRLGLMRPVTELHIRPTVFRVPPGKVEEDLVSVMMPFEMSFDRTYEAIGGACNACSLRCQRADDIWDEPEIIQDVFSLIYRSRVVVCDFTGRNANVFYEAGIAHTLGKTVVPITQSKDDVPFDLGHLRFVKYLANNEGREELRVKIEKKLRTITGV
jgi:hypothetical protein